MGAVGNYVGGMSVGLVASQPDSNIDCLCLNTTPAGLQDVFPKYALNLLNIIPQSVFRFATIAYDKFEGLRNENYKQKTQSQFKKDGVYQKHAQFGALKVHDVKEFVRLIRTAPRLDEYIQNITQPILFVYGGEDRAVMNIKNNQLPKEIVNLYERTKSKDKRLLVVSGADHSLNEKTKIDDCFNQDQKYQSVKQETLNHFLEYL